MKKCILFTILALSLVSTGLLSSCGSGDYDDYDYPDYPDEYNKSSDNNNNNSSTTKTEYTYNGHSCIDLGLPSGVKWATSNLGASNMTDYGQYIAWGETVPDASNKYSEATNKYITVPSAGSPYPWKYTTSGGPYSLETSDDAATKNWGSSWRMPTVSDYKELIAYCKLTYETVNNVKVIRFTSNQNGSSIVIPFGGNKSYSKSYSVGDAFYILTSELAYHYVTSGMYKSANYCAVIYGDKGGTDLHALARYCGANVRPVYGQPKSGTQGSNDDNGGGSSSADELALNNTDITGYSTKISAKFYFSNSLKSAKIYYGTTSSCSSSASTSMSTKEAYAYISGLKKNTKYYIKCKATDKNGSSITTDVYTCMTTN